MRDEANGFILHPSDFILCKRRDTTGSLRGGQRHLERLSVAQANSLCYIDQGALSRIRRADLVFPQPLPSTHAMEFPPIAPVSQVVRQSPIADVAGEVL